MKSTLQRIRRLPSVFGWAGTILRIDLGDMRVEATDSTALFPDFLGARGFAARVAWDEYPEPIEPFDAANPLMIFGGALTGSRAPYSGRATICAFSPQGYPHRWFTRSNIGGRFGGEMKRAGYDGIIITGAAEEPVRIGINDGEIRIVSARELWGLDAIDTIDAIVAEEGEGCRSLTIGPAGERLSRIATIQTDTSSASGQGGFGAVMGAKNLKAVTVRGSGRIALADPERMTAVSRALAKQASTPAWFGKDMREFNRKLAEEGNGRARLRACSEACVTPCSVEFIDVPGRVHNRTWSGDWVCIGCFFTGPSPDAPPAVREMYAWNLDRRAAFEMNVLSNRYGLNQFDILLGIAPWLIGCQKAGLLSEYNQREPEWSSPHFWDELLHSIAYREGMGDALAEGGWAAAHDLGLGAEIAGVHYPGWGHPSHWDGHNLWNHPFPYWIPAVLQWMIDTRDPFSTGHGSLRAMQFMRMIAESSDPSERERILEKSHTWGNLIYGGSFKNPCPLRQNECQR